METFAGLTDKFKTDKGSKVHSYADYYDLFFSPVRETATKVLEIGVHRWKSVLALEAYFPNAQIIGIDVRVYKPRTLGRIATFKCRQERRDHLAELVRVSGPEYDIIIDDGSHKQIHQQISLGFLFRYVKPGGLYIIEDLHASLSSKFILGAKITTLDMCEEFIRTAELRSDQFTLEEQEYLATNIRDVTLMRTNVLFPSIVAILRKKRVITV